MDDVDENKEVSKNINKFGKMLKKKLKGLMVAKKLNMEKITRKLALNVMMISHWINLWNYAYWQKLLGMLLVKIVNFTLNYF